jgi:hypothetical protein
MKSSIYRSPYGGDQPSWREGKGHMQATALLKRTCGGQEAMPDFSRTSARSARRSQELIDKIAEELEIHSTIRRRSVLSRRQKRARRAELGE